MQALKKFISITKINPTNISSRKTRNQNGNYIYK